MEEVDLFALRSRARIDPASLSSDEKNHLLAARVKMRWLPSDGITLRHPSGMLVHGPGSTEVIQNAISGSSANSAVFATIQAYVDHFVEPTLRLWRGPRQDMDHAEAVVDHPIETLLSEPNPHFTMDEIDAWRRWMLLLDGNAYVLKVRAGGGTAYVGPDGKVNTTGQVIQLWPVSPSMMGPVRERGSTEFIDYYAIKSPSGKPLQVPVENVIHFRMGIDDKNPLLGVGPVKQVAREVETDAVAEQFVNAIIKNVGVPGLVFSPTENGLGLGMTKTEAEEIKRSVWARTTGDRRGEPIVLPMGVRVDQFGFAPDVMNLNGVWDHVETRISAVIGVPAIVAGLNAGLMRSTFSNFREAREMFTEQRLVPAWRADGSRWTLGLRADFRLRGDEFLAYDMSAVSALQEDQSKFREYALTAWEKNVLTLGELYRVLNLGDVPLDVADLRFVDLDSSGALGGTAGIAAGNALATALSEMRGFSQKALPVVVEPAFDLKTIGLHASEADIIAPSHDEIAEEDVTLAVKEGAPERFIPSPGQPMRHDDLAAEAVVTPADVEEAAQLWDQWVREEGITIGGVSAVGFARAVPTHKAPKAKDGEALVPRWTGAALVWVKADPVPGVSWYWDVASQRYRYPNNARAVSPREVSRVLEVRLRRSRGEMEKATKRLLSGEWTSAEFQAVLAHEIKMAHVTARMIGVGGAEMMDARHFGSTGGLLRKQYDFLDRFGQAIQDGKLTEKQITLRSMMYGQAAPRDDFERGRRISHKDAQFDEERRVIQSGKPCAGCQSEAGRGWYPLGDGTPIGAHECNGNDKCTFEFRRTGAAPQSALEEG